MKAILLTQTGAPDVLQLADIPEPAIATPSQIKVQLKAAGVNPIDTKLRQRGLFYENALPAVLGCDGAGVVVETGAAVSKFKLGDKVWFCHGGLGQEPGNYAEFNVLDERWAAPMPKSLSFEQAAAGPLVLITAWGALYDRARLQAAHTVLIHAGAGGVGHVAIQLAKLQGARVITTVGSEEKAALARRYGADETVNYRSFDFVQAVNELTDYRGAEVVLDTVGPEVFERSIECTAHFGTLITLLDCGKPSFKEARMRNLRIGFELMLTPMLRKLDKARDLHVDMLNQCGRWIDEGRLKVHVSEVLPLAEAAKAHALIEAGHMSGKAVLKIG
ncbi:MAG: zinc-dependent alcohol dehydrogenase family protein [Methylococcaceae bacterium]|nr:zinc-dependent alcohol dehydrogenase family protein [Methylococcaceae bacterium]